MQTQEREGLTLNEAVLVVLEADGELDMATAPQLRERMRAAVAAGARDVVLDLTTVTFMDSVAMAAILHVRRDLGPGGRLAVVVPRDSYPYLVLEIAGLPTCLDLFDTREEAVAHLAVRP